MSKISFAVIGAGHIGKRHAQMILENPKAELKGIVDTDTKLEKTLPATFQIPFFDSLEKFLQSDIKVDVIAICTPNHLHCLQALKALEYSHVVIEKPMGLNEKECLEVIQKGKSLDKKVFCVMQNRYSPPSLLLKSIIEENRLGKIFNVQVNCFWNRDKRYYEPNGIKHLWKGIKALDGGVLYTQFSHFLDTLYWLFGPIDVTSKNTANFSHPDLDLTDDTGLFTFKLKDGGIGSFNYSTSVWGANMESSMTIIGEKGSIKIAGQYMNEVIHCNIQDYELPELKATNPPNDYGTYKGSAANHQYVFENIIDVLTEDKPITTNAQDGLEVVKIISQVYS